MRPLREGVVALVVLGLTSMAACNRGPAEEALVVAEQAREDAREGLERFAPEELVRLGQRLDRARLDLAEGRYTEALRAAQELPAQFRRARDLADRRRDAALSAAWDEVSRGLPTRLGGLRARVAGFAIAPILSAAPDEAWLAEARAELRAMGQAWAEAVAAHEGGDIPRALTIARDVEARAEALAERLVPPSAPQVDPG